MPPPAWVRWGAKAPSSAYLGEGEHLAPSCSSQAHSCCGCGEKLYPASRAAGPLQQCASTGVLLGGPWRCSSYTTSPSQPHAACWG